MSFNKPKMATTSEINRAYKVVNDLLKVENGLMNSEIDFIESLSHGKRRMLTVKQVKWLDTIYERVC